MSGTGTDPRCPECGGKIGATATYCMHCSADLTEERNAADRNENGVWDDAELPDEPATTTATGDRGTTTSGGEGSRTTGHAERTGSRGGRDVSRQSSGEILDPDGLVDNTLTVVVGIVGGIVVGLVGTIVLGVMTESAWSLLFGFVAWLGSTAYLVRRRTVQGAVSKSGYAVAVVLLLVPLIALSPLASIEGGMAERGELFVVLLVFSVFPAAFAAGIGWIAGLFVPDDASGSEG